MNPKATTRLYGLIGTPIDHSFSPSMHNTAFEAVGEDGCYLAFDTNINDLKDTVNALKRLDAKGWNVTMPLKSEMINFCDELSIEAKMIGAVNTIVNTNGRLKGYSTDGIGFFRNAKENGVDVKDKKILLLGAGGAARSIAAQSVLEEIDELIIFNRTLENAQRILEDIKEEAEKHNVKVRVASLSDKELLKKEISESDLLINATSVGMTPDEDFFLLTEDDLPENIVVADIVYTPTKTKLQQMAENKGLKILDGIGMVLWQGAYAFKLWTGKDFPVDLVKQEVFQVDID